MGPNANFGEKVDLTCSLEELEPSTDETYEPNIEPECVFTIEDVNKESVFDIVGPVEESKYQIPDRDEMIKAQGSRSRSNSK
jgi:hypothetical protein